LCCLCTAPEFARLASEKKATALFLTVDGDANRSLVQAKGVSGFPTFHFYVKGTLVASFSGADQSTLAITVELLPLQQAKVIAGEQSVESETFLCDCRSLPPVSSSSCMDISSYNTKKVTMDDAMNNLKSAVDVCVLLLLNVTICVKQVHHLVLCLNSLWSHYEYKLPT
jgi:hypothetical protein